MRPPINVYSPFKFLNSFQKDDYDIFFGRDKESLNLFELYRDTSLLILHGPSGSGKTSLIQCGLLNRLRINNNAIISIRRNNDIIESFSEKIFGILKEEGETMPTGQIDLIMDYLDIMEKFDVRLKEIDNLEDAAIALEEQVSKLRQEQLYHTKKGSATENLAPAKLENISASIEEKENKIDNILQQKRALYSEFGEKENLKNEALTAIKTYFQAIFRKVGTVPLVIFDQFEELFVYGAQEEIKKFGLILKLIFDTHIPLNILISLREEYFGHLDLLQGYIPNIFYKKIRLSHPTKGTVKEIIYKSFQKFNINQWKYVTNANVHETLSEEEKIKRIDLIIEQITIKEDDSVCYHLPFLQVYLDRLYKVDHYKTYGNDIPPGFEEAYGKNLPLEFEVSEIMEFGTIETVLEQYIREINNKILENGDNKLDNRRIHRNAAIKFLRNFKTKDDIKRRVPITIKDQHYIIADKQLRHQIQLDIWGESNDAEYEATISEIIDNLAETGIFNVSSDHVELSHDIIAKVIGNIKIEEDFLILLRNDFNTSFEIYENTEDAKDLLTEQQLQRMLQYRQFVLIDDNTDRLAHKKDFFTRSREKVDINNRKEIRQKEVQNEKLQAVNAQLENAIAEKSRQYKKGKKYYNWARIVSVIMFVTLLSTLYFFYENKKNKDRIEKELKTKQEQNELIDSQLKQLSKIKTESDSIKTLLAGTIINLEEQVDSISNWRPVSLYAHQNQSYSTQNREVTASRQSERTQQSVQTRQRAPTQQSIQTRPSVLGQESGLVQQSGIGAQGNTENSTAGQIGYTKNDRTNSILVRTNNSQYLLTVYGYAISEKEYRAVEKRLNAKGYSVNEGYVLSYRPRWLATVPMVLYYDQSSAPKAKELALWMTKMTSVKFGIQKGSGLGVIKGQEKNTFFIHYVGQTGK